MGIPNLFILGAGKSGTTTLYNLLKRHPDIHVCDPKEPSFFCSHFQVVQDPISYFNLFNSDRRYRLDASHVYFSNPETPPILYDLFPKAKFILILRHPKARAQALYQHMRRSIHRDGRPLELCESFHESLALEELRFNSPEFASSCRQYFWNFMYMRSSVYDVQILRYKKFYHDDQLLILTLAEFQNQPNVVCSKLANFLDLEVDTFFGDIPVSNAAPAYAPFSSICDALMEDHFKDLTHCVDAMVGRSLDWSL